ncbi:MAG: PUA domain-containing protein [Candidatus Asgardarchaeia archaeon]
MKFVKPTENELFVLRSIANYQFSEDIGKYLFTDDILVFKSPKTKRIRTVSLNGQIIASLRAHDNFILLTPEGASRIISKLNGKFVVVAADVAIPFIKKGRSLFAKHVLNADTSIVPKSEVIVVSKENEVIATGTALLSADEMIMFKKGIAVKIRHGINT